jgi:hypothetical protein
MDAKSMIAVMTSTPTSREGRRSASPGSFLARPVRGFCDRLRGLDTLSVRVLCDSAVYLGLLERELCQSSNDPRNDPGGQNENQGCEDPRGKREDALQKRIDWLRCNRELQSNQESAQDEEHDDPVHTPTDPATRIDSGAFLVSEHQRGDSVV